MEQLAERRNGRRLAINEEVFDQKTKESIGHTADLNAHGMMLVGKTEFTIGEETRVSIYVPNGRERKTHRTYK